MAKLKNWRVWLAIVVIFVSGFLTGGLFLAAIVHHRIDDMREGGPRAYEGMVVHLLDWRLKLDVSQEAEVARIVRDVHVELLEFKQEHQEEIEAIVMEGLGRIEATLHDDQRERWNETRTRVEKHLRARIEPK